MQPKIIYYVAVSLDGYISGPNEDISAFAEVAERSPEGLAQYQRDLLEFSTVIMGRKTYEFGYRYGLEPGQPAYPHMEHHIFSTTLRLDRPHPKVHVEAVSIGRVREIRDFATSLVADADRSGSSASAPNQAGSDIYLCGGGEFAGWLLDHGMIDRLKLKLNPIVLGGGTRLFGSSTTAVNWRRIDQQAFAGGLTFLTFEKA